MPNPFWNATEMRLRALWRMLGQVVLMIMLLFLGTALFGDRLQTSRMNVALVQLVGIGGSVLLAARWFDRRPIANLGLVPSARWWLHFTFGLALGIALISGIYLLQRALGWVEVVAVTNPATVLTTDSMLTMLFFFLCVGITEEVWMRGYLIPNLSEGLHSRRVGARAAVIAALLISSVTFGLLHVPNPNASLFSTLNIVLAGIVLGLPFVWTGSLAIPIGLHFTWNAAQGLGYGFPVSGLTDFPSLIHTRETGPDLWTGGAFGPEAGLTGVLALLLAGGLIYAWLRLSEQRPSTRTSLATPPGTLTRPSSAETPI